ncbi:CocE/NonD family hydrolase [Sphingomonas arantia]|uniref:CocE/NonD family hydrolase n=1 Tax=Sphingomonas arantia TaxID=1460676 RepID=A0ABW4TSA2_9SPHN
MRFKSFDLVAAALLLGTALAPAAAQIESKVATVAAIPPGGDVPKAFVPVRTGYDYVKRTVMIPMRDGVKLHTVILVPNAVKRGPIMLDRTPYDADRMLARGGGGPLIEQNLSPAYAELARAGYIIVGQDVRGKDGSGGDYVMNRPLRGPLNPTKVDHATDAYDTIDWLVKNVPESNGRVGTIGTSYDGFTALMSLINPHPALKASVPINPMVDVWKGDDWFHNGAFRQEMMSYVYKQTATKGSDLEWYSTRYDDYDTFMAYGSPAAYGRAMKMEQLPFWNRILQHPAYDAFWQEQAVDKLLAKAPLTVPTLFVDSLWDQEDIYGAPAAFAATKARSNGKAHLVLGPWHHGQGNGDASRLGAIEFGSDTGKAFRRDVMIPFLDSKLKEGAPAADIAPVTAYETGTNRWTRHADWPLACTTGCATGMTPMYLTANSGLTLGTAPAATAAAYDEYISDPAKPVTYRQRPNISPWATGSTWRQWLVDDQRFAAGRSDVLTYSTPVLTAPVKIAGQAIAHLFASTSGTDSDWVVKLIDVYPDLVPEKPEMGGYQLAVAMDVLRARYRDDPSKATPVPAGQVVPYAITLPDADHVFLPGHRIMVQVQSSWFPLYDRNPQTFVPNILDAKPADYVKATQRIYHAPSRASYIALPVVR